VLDGSAEAQTAVYIQEAAEADHQISIADLAKQLVDARLSEANMLRKLRFAFHCIW
jgi:hypothetical protein